MSVALVAKRSWAAAIALALPAALAGCLSQVLPEPAPPPLTYDFGPLPEESPAPLPQRFRLAGVTAPSWYESPNIYYRRLAEQPAALLPYSRNRWIASAAELFAERLSYRLAQAEPDASSRALPLTFSLSSFEQVYTSATEAYVIARARASYEDADGRRHERGFETRLPAAASVEGATAELPRAAARLLDDVLAWLSDAASRP